MSNCARCCSSCRTWLSSPPRPRSKRPPRQSELWIGGGGDAMRICREPAACHGGPPPREQSVPRASAEAKGILPLWIDCGLGSALRGTTLSPALAGFDLVCLAGASSGAVEGRSPAEGGFMLIAPVEAIAEYYPMRRQGYPQARPMRHVLLHGPLSRLVSG